MSLIEFYFLHINHVCALKYGQSQAKRMNKYVLDSFNNFYPILNDQ